MQRAARWTQEKYLISRKYFEIYQMVGNISIDGFKRERYIVKVKDISDELVRAYQALNEEELKVEAAYTATKLNAPLTGHYSIQSDNMRSYSTEREYA